MVTQGFMQSMVDAAPCFLQASVVPTSTPLVQSSDTEPSAEVLKTIG